MAAWDKQGLDPRAGLQGAFRKATHALATTLVHADVDDLYHEMLLLRHWEQEVARTEQAPATQHLLATLARYQALLDQGPYAAHVKHAQQTALAGYAEALRTYLAPTTPMQARAKAISHAATRRAAGDLGLGMVAVLIGCLVAWTIRLRTIRPVQQRANVATQLTAGF